MANGLPVIATKTGIQGLDLINKKDVLIANKPEEFVKQITNILENPTLYRQIQKNAFELIKSRYNWNKIAQQLEIIYEKIVSHENWN